MSAAERSAKYRAKNVDEYRKRKAEYAKTPEQRAARTEYMRKWRELNRDRHNETARISHAKNRSYESARKSHLLYMYGITVEQWEIKFAEQGGKCAICGKEPRKDSKKKWHVDHCHKTGKLRGILCNYCNPALAFYEKYKEKADDYLKTSW